MEKKRNVVRFSDRTYRLSRENYCDLKKQKITRVRRLTNLPYDSFKLKKPDQN